MFIHLLNVVLYLSRMGEPVELHDVMGRTAGVDNETVLDYEIPAASRSDENVYNTLAETVTPSSKIGDNPSENVNEEAVFKPGTYAFALRKVQIFCLILSVMLVISSVTIGVFIHTLVSWHHGNVSVQTLTQICINI